MPNVSNFNQQTTINLVNFEFEKLLIFVIIVNKMLIIKFVLSIIIN